MSTVKTFDLGDHFGAFVDAQVETGNFETADQVVRAALSLLERRSIEEDVRIRAAIEEGLASGVPREFDWDELYREIEAQAQAGSDLESGASPSGHQRAEAEAEIRAAIEAGFARGEPAPFNVDEFLTRMHRSLGMRTCEPRQLSAGGGTGSGGHLYS